MQTITYVGRLVSATALFFQEIAEIFVHFTETYYGLLYKYGNSRAVSRRIWGNHNFSRLIHGCQFSAGNYTHKYMHPHIHTHTHTHTHTMMMINDNNDNDDDADDDDNDDDDR